VVPCHRSFLFYFLPVIEMGGELAGWNNITVLLPYGESFRRQSKDILHVMGTPASMKRFHSIEEAEMRQFLRRILDRPSDLAAVIQHAVGAIILGISYGYKVKEEDDPLVALADKALEQFSLAILPGAYLVDVVPFCASYHPLRRQSPFMPSRRSETCPCVGSGSRIREACSIHV
jgi:hypothetical protein